MRIVKNWKPGDGVPTLISVTSGDQWYGEFSVENFSHLNSHDSEGTEEYAVRSYESIEDDVAERLELSYNICSRVSIEALRGMNDDLLGMMEARLRLSKALSEMISVSNEAVGSQEGLLGKYTALANELKSLIEIVGAEYKSGTASNDLKEAFHQHIEKFGKSEEKKEE